MQYVSPNISIFNDFVFFLLCCSTVHLAHFGFSFTVIILFGVLPSFVTWLFAFHVTLSFINLSLHSVFFFCLSPTCFFCGKDKKQKYGDGTDTSWICHNHFCVVPICDCGKQCHSGKLTVLDQKGRPGEWIQHAQTLQSGYILSLFYLTTISCHVKLAWLLY